MVLPFTTVAGHINYTSLLGYYCNSRAVKNNPLRSGSAGPAPKKIHLLVGNGGGMPMEERLPVSY
jgi:hypothetical protein